MQVSFCSFQECSKSQQKPAKAPYIQLSLLEGKCNFLMNFKRTNKCFSLKLHLNVLLKKNKYQVCKLTPADMIMKQGAFAASYYRETCLNRTYRGPIFLSTLYRCPLQTVSIHETLKFWGKIFCALQACIRFRVCPLGLLYYRFEVRKPILLQNLVLSINHW